MYAKHILFTHAGGVILMVEILSNEPSIMLFQLHLNRNVYLNTACLNLQALRCVCDNNSDKSLTLMA